jgi:hypothetical protein
VLGERHLRRMLARYIAYYQQTRTHLSLTKDAPTPRRVQTVTEGGRFAPKQIKTPQAVVPTEKSVRLDSVDLAGDTCASRIPILSLNQGLRQRCVAPDV